MSNLSTHNVLKIFLINFLGVLSFSAVLILIFIDIWAFQNGESSDIAARGSFLAGFLFLPTFVIFTLLIGTISYFLFRKNMKWTEILLGIVSSMVLFSALFISRTLFFLYYPYKLLSQIVPYSGYLYFIIPIVLFFLLIRRYRTTPNKSV